MKVHGRQVMYGKNLIVAFGLGLVMSWSAIAEADEYAALRDVIEICNGCHGEGGASKDDAFPVLAGQELHYLYVQLKDFKSKLRENQVMSLIVGDLEKPQLLKLAKFYSEQTWPNIGFRGDPEEIAKGEMAANSGQCVACHLGSYTGNSRIPRVAGQYPEYLEKTMLDMRSKARNNAAAMSSLMSVFSESDIAAMAEFMGDL